jgi:hypothetical protein
MKYEYLQEKANDFIKCLQEATKLATNEDEYSDLEDIAEDVLNCIPNELLQSDYITRTTIANYIEDGEDTKTLNKFMQKVCDDCVFHLDDEAVCDNLEVCANKFFEENKGE